MRRTPISLLVMAAAFALAAASASPALAASTRPAKTTHGGGHGGGGGGSTAVVGNDVSYPQCGAALPGDAAFGIVGVNDGIVYSANPCLTDELRWAEATGQPAFYANTADPGPAYSHYWKVAAWNDTPRPCAATDANTPDCSYDYGWYAARDSFADATAAELALGKGGSAAAVPWWLDVETGNSWQSLESAYSGDLAAAYANDTAAIQGAVDYLAAQGVPSVGIYSTGYQWGRITGGAPLDPAHPDWLAGYSSAAAAQSACSSATGFSGGAVALTQYVHKLDYDVRC